MRKIVVAQLLNFKFALTASVLVGGWVMVALGPIAILPLIILVVIEILFSFDNAIVNAQILKTLSPLWRQLFLTVGIIVAVFGMRLFFPIVLVAISSQTGLGETITLALSDGGRYAHELENAHPAISSFGGIFLLLLALSFFMLDAGRPLWIKRIERPLRRVGSRGVVLAVTLGAVAIIVLLPTNEHKLVTLVASGSAVLLFYAISLLRSSIGGLNRGAQSQSLLTGWAAFLSFMYLEVLDASFSLDAVLGAFAVTSDVLLIAAGLGIGAVWVRSLTVYMIKRGTLATLAFLEHGAHYAILLLAGSLLFSLFIDVHSAIIGALGVAIIIASVIGSRRVQPD